MQAAERHKQYEWKPSRLWYGIGRAVFALLFHSLWPLTIRGRENVPRNGAAIIVSNHVSMLDPFVVGYGAGRIVNFMAKEELFRTPIVGWFVRKLGAFPVDRARRDAASLRTALTVLKEDELLGMFPEGTRGTGDGLLEFRTGALRLASRTRAPIVPTAVIGTEEALPRKKFVRPARLAVHFGPPVEVTELYDNPKDPEAMERAIEAMKAAVQALHDSID
ncbi:MAG TPA: lysophospholipid acyltransferase family protein [Chloroflexia bacterium]|nr:lysophospholipid acyltransferase family protein [Chloroflexia bacterium]